MRHHDRLPIIALCVLVLLIVFAGPLVGIVHSLHADPNIVGVFIGVVAAASIVLLVFRRHLGSLFSSVGRHIAQLEDGLLDDGEAYPPLGQQEEYPALPAPGQTSQAAPSSHPWQDHDQQTQGRVASQRSRDAYDAQGEPVLLLADNCPLPFTSAFHHTLIYEEPGAGRRDRSIAARLYIELFGTLGIPLLVITRNPSYASVLPFLDNGWLAGNPQAREERLSLLARILPQEPQRAQHYASIDQRNARSFAKKAIAYGAQVVVDISTYNSEPGQMSPVVWKLLLGAQESEQPCLIMLLDADYWAPDMPLHRRAYGSVQDDPHDPQAQLQAQIQRVLSKLMASHHVLYLVTSTLMVDEDLIKRCALWMLNREPQNGRDASFFCDQTRLSREGLQCLRDHSILAEPRSGTAMELVLHPHQSAHEEPSYRRSAPRLLHDLSQIAADEEEEPRRLGK